MNSNLKQILDQPSYWKEGVNGLLYNALIEFMEAKNINKTELANHLGITKGRLSQILNNGEMNFSLEKIFEILIKLDKYPKFEIIDSKTLLSEQKSSPNFINTKVYHPKLNRQKTNDLGVGI